MITESDKHGKFIQIAVAAPASGAYCPPEVYALDEFGDVFKYTEWETEAKQEGKFFSKTQYLHGWKLLSK